MLSYWREFSHCQVPIVRARVEDIVRRVTGPRVLEVGCNEGWVSKAIIEERGFDVTSVDNRTQAIHQAQELFGLSPIQADVNRLPFRNEEFDCVVAGEILEHLPNPGQGLSEIFRVSKGHVILTLPIGRYWNDEPTHAWQINGSIIEHENGSKIDFFKHAFCFEFRGIRRLNGEVYEKLNDGHADR